MLPHLTLALLTVLGQVDVTVVDGDDTGIGHAEVQAIQNGRDSGRPVHTDRDGKTEIPHHNPGDKIGLLAYKPGFEDTYEGAEEDYSDNGIPPSVTITLRYLHSATIYGSPDTGPRFYDDEFVLSLDSRLGAARWAMQRIDVRKGAPIHDSAVKAKWRPHESKLEFVVDQADYQSTSEVKPGYLAGYGEKVRGWQNTAPMVPSFARFWENLSDSSLLLLRKHEADQAFIISGAVLADDNRQRRTFGDHSIPIPSLYYRVILGIRSSEDVKHYRLWAYLFPNKPVEDNVSLPKFAVPTAQVEKVTGYTFWGKLVSRQHPQELQASKSEIMTEWRKLPSDSR